MNTSKAAMAPNMWHLGGIGLSVWSLGFYLLFILALALPRLMAGSSWPLYGHDEFVTGSYPLIWLVYICMPLVARDIYIYRKRSSPWPPVFKRALWTAILVSLPVYPFVFGWL